MATRILIVAGDRLARVGLAALLAAEPGVVIAGQIGADAATPEALDLYRPDTVLWDAVNPARDLERVADLCAAGARVAALLVDEAQAAQLWQAGVRGLLGRDADTPALVAALTAVAQGLAALAPPLVVALKTNGEVEIGLEQPLSEALTPREREVLQRLAEGLSNKAIARSLGISEHTVKFHITALLGKLGVQSRTEAVVRAMRLGLVSV